jgi:polysaccharide export outer membrane protein
MLRRSFVLMAVLLLACGPRPDNSQVRLPPPVESTTLGPGDVLRVSIVGEKDLPEEFQVAPDGTIDLPYIDALRVDGMEPQEIARLIRKTLVEKKILASPSVIVIVKEYNSKQVSVLGQVQKPGSFPLAPGMTLIQVISEAGGLNAIANRDRVNITRRTGNGTRTVVVSLDAITDGIAPDIPLQSGDRIFVNERVF